jgi:hypothetical protein
MAKQAGMGDQLYVGGVKVSNDIGSLSKLGGGPAVQDVTGIDKFAMERLGLERDGSMEFACWFNPTVAHPVFSALPTTDVMLTYGHGTTIGNPALCLIGKQINYDFTRAADGSLVGAVTAQANGFGIEWGLQLTAGQRTDTTATSPATGVDVTDGVTVSTAFGWQAYLQVFAGFVGTSATVTLQDSADNSAFANLTSGAFIAATGITTQRLQSGATDTVRRYVRAITTGTFTNVTFTVVFVRNMTAVAF